jgi:hypothetical protein
MIRKLPKKVKRDGRFRSQRHLSHIRSHACVVCDASAPIEAAHVRIGSGAGMGQRPHDFFATSLCKDCHQRQHTVGERTFWQGKDVGAIIRAFIKTSPAAREIRQFMAENGIDANSI